MNVVRCTIHKATLATVLCAVAGLASGAAAQTATLPIVLARGAPAGSPVSVPAASPAAFPPRPNANTAAMSVPSTPASAPASETAPVNVSGRPPMTANFNVPTPEEKVLHVLVGHSAFVETRHRLSRVYITNPDVLNSYTSSPNQVVITAKQAGTCNFIVWDEVGDTQVYLISAETSMDGLRTAIKTAFPSEDIKVDDTGGHLTLTGTVGAQTTSDAVGKLVAQYAKDATNALFVSSSKLKQVRLKVRFAEVDRSRITQLGFNIFGILNASGNATLVQSTTGAFPSNPQINTGSSTSGPSVNGRSIVVSNALNYFLYDFQHEIGATIQDLENRNILHILAEPNIVAMSGEKANFLAGGEFPFPIVQGGVGGTAASVTILFKPYGVKLDFTPVVNADGTIDLTVAPEVSALDYSNAVTISGYTVPALSTRRASTQIVLQNGQTFAISGLLDQRTTDAFAKTPGAASIPVLGALFHSKNLSHSNTELVVIVTPEIVDPLTNLPEEIKQPTSPIPLMNQQQFDDKLPKMEKKPSANN